MDKPTSMKHDKAIPQGKITFEAFLDWADEDSHAEWEDEKIIMPSPASLEHQDIANWLTFILRVYVRRQKLGHVIGDSFTMRLHETDQAREPDVMFIKSENLGRLQTTYLDGPADLVVEVISPESISRDRGRKFVEYEQEGISEYWLIDPIRQQAEFYQLGEDGHYHPALPDADGIYHSAAVDGFWLRVSWLRESPLPDELETLSELGIS